jgi:hypothetical protein
MGIRIRTSALSRRYHVGIQILSLLFIMTSITCFAATEKKCEVLFPWLKQEQKIFNTFLQASMDPLTALKKSGGLYRIDPGTPKNGPDVEISFHSERGRIGALLVDLFLGNTNTELDLLGVEHILSKTPFHGKKTYVMTLHGPIQQIAKALRYLSDGRTKMLGTLIGGPIVQWKALHAARNDLRTQAIKENLEYVFSFAESSDRFFQKRREILKDRESLLIGQIPQHDWPEYDADYNQLQAPVLKLQNVDFGQVQTALGKHMDRLHYDETEGKSYNTSIFHHSSRQDLITTLELLEHYNIISTQEMLWHLKYHGVLNVGFQYALE